MEQKNKRYDEINKTNKQEYAVTNAQLKRKNMELQELDNKIARADQENKELKSIADELMMRMEQM